MAEPLAPRPRPQLRVLAGGAPAFEVSYTDTELFEGIAAGDERVARVLYRRALPEVETTLLRLLSQRDAQHDELVQSSLERMIATVSERRYAEACSLNTWASAFASQAALGVLRARQRKSTAPIELGAVDPLPVAGAAGAVSPRQSERQTEWLRANVARLAPARAEAIVLHDLMGHPLAEIAIMMRLSLSAAQSRLVRARKELVVALLAQPGKLPDLDDLFLAWKGQSKERARSLTLGRGGSRLVARALARVGRRQRRVRRLRVVGASFAAVVTLLGIGSGVWLAQRQLRGDEHASHSEPHVLLGGVLGEVSVSDGEGRPATGFASLGEGYGLRTDLGSARLGFTSGAAVSVANHSRLAILSTRESEVFFLGTGAVEVDVPDLAFGGSFAVETPDTHLSSHAAQFEVAVDPAAAQGATRVDVRKGSVSVQHAGRRHELQAGQTWPAAAEQGEPLPVDVTLDTPLVDLPLVVPRATP